MATPISILIVEDSAEDAALLVDELKSGGFEPKWKRVQTEADYRAGLEELPDLIISDYTMPQFGGLRAMDLLRERGLDIPFILVSGSVGEEEAVEAMKHGATDYLLKDRVGRLWSAVEGALEQKRLRDERRRMKQQLEDRNIELEQRIRLAALSAGVGAALMHGNTLRDVLQRCCEALVEHLDAAFARIWSHNERENVLELQASAGMYTHIDEPHGRVPVGKSNIGLIAEERKPHLTNSVIGDPRVPEQEWARREGLVAFAGYPLVIGDRVVGVMAIFARHSLSQTTLDAMASIADGVALGIERKRAEEELRAAHAQLRHLLDHSPAVIYALRVEGDNIVPHVVSENITQLLGFTVPETLRYEWWAGQLHPQDRDMAIASVSETLTHGTSRTEYRLRHKHGDYRWVEDNRRVVYGPSNQPVEIAGVWTDITERKQLEEQLRQSQKMEGIGQLAGGVAHDFNNILAVIQMQSELLKDSGGLSADQLAFAGEIGTTVQRAAALTRQLLLFSRREVFQPRDLNLSESIKSTAKMLIRILGDGIHMQLRLAPEPMIVHADGGMMDQVLMNLVVNARDAMGNGGQLVIETSGVEFDESSAFESAQGHVGSFVRLSVSDSGSGIPPEILPKIFEPFFTTKDVGTGTGLGLATVFGIVQQHQGWVDVDSDADRGTTFRIYLPRLTNSEAAKPSQPSLTATCGGNETILLAEDDPALRVSVRKALSQLGYRILEAPTGVKALAVWKENHDEIRLLLTDLVMPGGMTGIDLAQRLLQENSELKVIYMSGYSAEVAGKEFPLKEGVNFLTKPFAGQKLAQTIRDQLDSHA